jgi:hypothetical protein
MSVATSAISASSDGARLLWSGWIDAVTAPH